MRFCSFELGFSVTLLIFAYAVISSVVMLKLVQTWTRYYVALH